MSGNTCTCGQTFRMGEDYRDHMPCPGDAREAAERKLAIAEARIRFLENNLRIILKTGNTRVTNAILLDLQFLLDS